LTLLPFPFPLFLSPFLFFFFLFFFLFFFFIKGLMTEIIETTAMNEGMNE